MESTLPRGLASALLLVALSADCFAQAYTVNLLVDGNTPIPGGTGNFSLYGIATTSTDGRYVVFVNNAPLSIYTYDTKTAQFAKIADLNTTPPGASAPLTSFFYNYNDPNGPIVANGTVVFWAASGANSAGIYSAPAAGGTIKLIAATGTAAPGTGGLFTNNFTEITTDGAKVAFTAVTSTGSTGTYTANIDGTNPTVIGDSSVVVDSGGVGVGYDDWYFPSISNGEVAVLAVVGAGDPSRTQNAIFTTPYTGIIGDPYPYTGPERATETVSTTNLPGNTNTNFHTRFDAFALNNSTLGILADDAFSTYTGIFSAPAAPGQVNAPLTKLADSVDNPNIEFASSLGIANDDGTIVFGARDMANNYVIAIYAYVSGQGLSLVAETGTPVANQPGSGVAGLSAGIGLNSAANGAIAFTSGSGNLYLATLDTTNITSVTTAYAGSAIAQNTFIVIKGTNLVPPNTPASGVIWSSAPSFASGQMPTQLNGVSVAVNNKPAFVYFYCSAVTDPACSQDQLNILTPLDNTIGPVPVVVTSGAASSPPFTVAMQAVAPSFLLFTSAGYIAATHGNYTYVGPTSLYPGASTPAQPGEEITLYAVGFGLPSAALVNGSSTQSGSLPVLPVCKLGVNPAAVAFAGLNGSPGLYQLNLTIPAAAANGDNPVSCTYGGATTPAGDLITVQ